MTEHVDNLVSKAGQTLYALKTLQSNGLASQLLHNVCKATLISRSVYASPAWRGFASQQDLSRIQAVYNRATRWGLCNLPRNELEIICSKADNKFFNKIQSNESHVLHRFLPPKRDMSYSLRARAHNFSLPFKTTLLEHNFFHRLLYKYSY